MNGCNLLIRLCLYEVHLAKNGFFKNSCLDCDGVCLLLMDLIKKTLLAYHDIIERQSLETSSTDFQKLLDELLLDLFKCMDFIRYEELFSKNENLQEVSTWNLPFLLVPAFIAEGLTRKTSNDRKNVLNSGIFYYTVFFEQCKSYGELIDDDDDMKIIDSFIKEESSTATIIIGGSREEKIRRFKRQRNLYSSLESVIECIRAKQDFSEEEILRHHFIAMLQYFILKSIESFQSTKLELLASDPNSRDNYPNGIALPKEPALPAGFTKIGSNRFVLTSKREQLMDQVFRPSYSLPTMSIDEFLQLEMQRGNILSGNSEKQKTQKAEEDDDDVNIYKERAFDEFKDDNPKGWGNVKNKA